MAKTSYKLSSVLFGHTSDVRAIATFADGSIVSTSRDKTARVWKPSGNGKDYIETAVLKGHTNFVSSVCVINPSEQNPKGLIITGSNDNTICVYEQDQIEPFHIIKAHQNTVSNLRTGKVENTFLSSSWDMTAKLWSTKDLTNPLVTLVGHTAAVWCVTDLVDGNVVTGSADKLIIVWQKDGSIKFKLSGHSDCVRGIISIKDSEFLSCSNDSTVRHWNSTTGTCLGNYSGHENYIYSITALTNGTYVFTSGEDRTIRVWLNGEIDQIITLPTQSVWCIDLLPNGDIVSGSSDSVVRIFSPIPERYASIETLQQFEEEVAKTTINSEQELGGLKIKDLPDAKALQQPGQKEGQTKMISNGNNVVAYSWSQNEQRWILIGNVVGASGGSTATSGKQLYNGIEYDYVFSVDIQDGVPPLKLPYNNGQDPWVVAQKFLHDNDLSQLFLDQVANFIIKNSQQTPILNDSVQYIDPFTGGNRYIPGSNITDSPSESSSRSNQSYSSLSSACPSYIPHMLSNGLSGIKVDSWSLGIIIAEQLLKKQIWSGVKLSQCLRKALSLIHCETSVFERLAREHNCFDIYEELSSEIKEFVDSCLQVHSSKRKTPEELLQLPLFIDLLMQNEQEKEESQYKNVIVRKMNELYYLWQLAGGDITVELKKQGLIRSRPPILSIPNLVILLGQIFGRRDTAGLLDLRVVKVSLDTLHQRLSHIPYIANYPWLTPEMRVHAQEDLTSAASQLPLIIRERDTEYQFYRLVLYDRLLQILPLTREAIIKEAHKDIPPLVRGAVWAALLDITGDVQQRYDMIDKETPTHTDRQIEVDIPRCHQYSELLSSGSGHERLQRLLKAWVRNNPHYVYWQGLDSLTAPFLYLNFNNEARAFECLSAFIPKYLHKFFLKDNSAVIQEYLGKFSQIIAFHDPQLANHLKSINFVPELFAIPWFLTMFSHVFPLHKILHLWDKLLLGDSSFPLLVGLAILKQLRDSLLASGFNECILLFSDLPEIDIELCVKDSMTMYQNTPPSITYRKHQLNRSKEMNWTDPEPGTEKMPRISVDDFLNLLNNTPDEVIAVDIRNNIQFERGAVIGSINIPFTSVQLSQTNIDTLGPHAKPLVDNKNCIVVIIGPHDQNNALFADFLVKCGVTGVCSLQGGIYALRTKSPNIIVSIR